MLLPGIPATEQNDGVLTWLTKRGENLGNSLQKLQRFCAGWYRSNYRRDYRGRQRSIALSNYWLLNVFDRRVADITPEQLTSFFNGVADAQGQARTERYIGKRIRVSGSLPTPLPPPRRTVIVTFVERSGPANVKVQCSVKGRKNVARIEAKSPGDEVTLVGRILSVARQSVILDFCKVLLS